MTAEQLEQKLLSVPLVAIARHIPCERLIPAAEALYAGGVRFIEVTMNSRGALDSIQALSRAFAHTDMSIGAGTVLGRAAARDALDAGASFLVCPHTDPAVIKAALEAEALPLPGVMTPTDVAQALDAGARVLKLFPAGALGAAYVRQLRAPFDRVPFFAVGGIDLENAAQYLAAGCAGLGLGGALVDAKAIEREDYAELTYKARRYLDLISDSSYPQE